MTSELFEKMNKAFGVLRDMEGVYQINLSNPAKSWVIDVAQKKVYEGKATKPNLTVTMSDSDFLALSKGAANPQQLFMSGKIKVKGNINLLMKLQTLQSLR